MMYMYRIAKYDLNNYENGIYTGADWTNYSDIGRTFNGVELTEKVYLHIESRYIRVAQILWKKSHCQSVCISNLEKYSSDLPWKNAQKIREAELAEIIRDCLRNKCWCRLYGENFYIHFGYDFYMYIGCTVPYAEVVRICRENQLYAVEQESPYLTIDLE